MAGDGGRSIGGVGPAARGAPGSWGGGDGEVVVRFGTPPTPSLTSPTGTPESSVEVFIAVAIARFKSVFAAV